MALGFFMGLVVSRVITKKLIGTGTKTDIHNIPNNANQEVHSNQREQQQNRDLAHSYCEIDGPNKNTYAQAKMIPGKTIAVTSDQPTAHTSRVFDSSEMTLKTNSSYNQVRTAIPEEIISVNPNKSYVESKIGNSKIVGSSEAGLKTNILYDLLEPIPVTSNESYEQPMTSRASKVVELSKVTMKTNTSYNKVEGVKKKETTASDLLEPREKVKSKQFCVRARENTEKITVEMYDYVDKERFGK